MASLYKLGPNYRFRTGFYANGIINKKTRTLNGDLVLVSTGDPMLMTADVSRLVRDVIRGGVTRVTGSLVVTGPFTYGNLWNTERAMHGMNLLLRKVGVRVMGGIKQGIPAGTELASHESMSLRDIAKQGRGVQAYAPTAEGTSGPALRHPRHYKGHNQNGQAPYYAQ